MLFDRVLTIALAAVSAMPLLVGTAQAQATPVCKMTATGGYMVGSEVVNSSHSVAGYTTGERQKIEIDLVLVNVFGQTRYRLAEDIDMLSPRSMSPTVGGKGSFLTPSEGDELSDKCVDKRLGGVQPPWSL